MRFVCSHRFSCSSEDVQDIPRNDSLPCCGVPDVASQMHVLNESTICMPSSYLLPCDASVMEKFSLPLGMLVSPLLESDHFVRVNDFAPICRECGE